MTLIKYHIFLILICLLSTVSISQTEKDEYYSWEPRPLRLLPSFIPIKDSSTYLWIDSSEITNNKILVYVINNSSKVLNFNGYQLAQIQPEFKAEDSKWYRVRSLFYGWCGTSYQDRVTIKPKEFYIDEDFIGNTNKKVLIRYTFFGTNIENSNTIWGNFDSTEVEIAKYDDISYMYCDSDYLASVIISLPKPYKYSTNKFKNLTPHQDSVMIRIYNETIISNAISSLNRRFPERVPEVMTIISKNKYHPLNKYAIDWLLKNKNK
jgi:hypothetical protein